MDRKARLVYVHKSGTKSEKEIVVGHLTFSGGVYSFRYDREAFEAPELKNIIKLLPFEQGKTSRNSRLFPFFSRRLPDNGRKDYKKTLDNKKISADDMFSRLLLNESKLVTDNFRIKSVFDDRQKDGTLISNK